MVLVGAQHGLEDADPLDDAFLPGDLPLEGVDCLYVNYPGTAIVGYMRQMLAKSFVVAQYPKGGQARRPCHVLVASRADLAEAKARLDELQATAILNLQLRRLADRRESLLLYQRVGD